MRMLKNRFHHSFFSTRKILYIVTLLFIGILLFLSWTVESAQQGREAPDRYQEIIENVRAENLSSTISRLQSQKNRSTWEEQWKAADWISDEFKIIGMEADIHRYEFKGKIWPNVIARIRGEERPDEIILLCAHLDSTSDHAGKIAPGADDNASGVAVLLEAARILQKIPMERTVIFAIFSNEEGAMAGSKAYARLARKEGRDIKSVINVDVIGYNRPQWPFYRDAMVEQLTPEKRLKVKAVMARNYALGLVNGKDMVIVAGREPNRQLVLSTSRTLRQSAGLSVEETIKNDCG